MAYTVQKLSLAIKRGNLNYVEKCIKEGIDITQPERPYKLICNAIESKQIEMVKYLLHKGVFLNCRTPRGETPFQQALFSGGRGMVDIFLQAGLTFESLYFAQSYFGTFPLSAVIDHELLDSSGATLLHYAAANGQTHIIERIKNVGADLSPRNAEGNTPLLIAAMNGHLETIKYLRECGVSLDEKDKSNNTPLLLAAHNGHSAVVEWLIKEGVNVNEANRHRITALMRAAESGQITMVRCLIEQGALLTATDSGRRTPLSYAIRSGQLSAVKYLLQQDKEQLLARSLHNYSALLLAVVHGHSEIIAYLLEQGASLLERDMFDNTPLLLAGEHGHKEIVAYLLNEGANTTVVSSEGDTLLLKAISSERVDLVKWLFNETSLIESNRRGWNAFLMAAHKGNKELVSWLLEQGADIEVRDNSGRNAFSLTLNNYEFPKAISAYKATLKYLLAQGVSTGNSQLGDRNIDILADILLDDKTIDTLDLSKNCLTVKGMQALSHVLATHPSLQVIYLADNPNLGEEGINILLQAYMNNSCLRYVTASNTGCNEKQYDMLKAINTERSRVKSARSVVDSAPRFSP